MFYSRKNVLLERKNVLLEKNVLFEEKKNNLGEALNIAQYR